MEYEASEEVYPYQQSHYEKKPKRKETKAKILIRSLRNYEGQPQIKKSIEKPVQ